MENHGRAARCPDYSHGETHIEWADVALRNLSSQWRAHMGFEPLRRAHVGAIYENSFGSVEKFQEEGTTQRN